MTDYRPLLEIPIQTEPARERWRASEIVAVLGAAVFVGALFWLGLVS